jgi:hypothetical protein
MQLDKVVVPAGLFAPARTYSLVRDDTGLYVIYTGRAMGNTPSGGGIAGVAAGAILDGIARKRAVEIEANEAKLRELGAAGMKDTKHSRFIPKSAITRVEVQHQRAIVAADKKLTFLYYEPGELKQFFAPFLQTQHS